MDKNLSNLILASKLQIRDTLVSSLLSLWIIIKMFNPITHKYFIILRGPLWYFLWSFMWFRRVLNYGLILDKIYNVTVNIS